MKNFFPKKKAKLTINKKVNNTYYFSIGLCKDNNTKAFLMFDRGFQQLIFNEQLKFEYVSLSEFISILYL